MSFAGERQAYAIAAAVLICAGLLSRWPALGLPWPIAKYAGSVLWGAMLYAVLRAIHPRASVLASLSTAVVVAVCVECFRLYHQTALDAFRATLAGKLLLGSIFSLWNEVAYVVGVGILAVVDARALRVRETSI